jgi:FixJ family two-component response regulator
MLQQERTMVAEVRRRYESLTKREREVMRLVLSVCLTSKSQASWEKRARQVGSHLRGDRVLR